MNNIEFIINKLLEAGIKTIHIYPTIEMGHDDIPKLLLSYKQAYALGMTVPIIPIIEGGTSGEFEI